MVQLISRAVTVLGLLLPTLTLTSCGSILSSSSSSSNASGVAYMLPKALLPVELTENSGVLMLTVKEPLILGDQAQHYVLERSSNPFSSDNVQITVNPNTGLLQAVKVESTEQSLSTIVKLVSSIKAEAADIGAASNLVFRGLLDPSNMNEDFNESLMAATKGYLNNRHAMACTKPDSSDCKAVRKLIDTVSGRSFGVYLASGTAASVNKEQAVNCSPGLCYRQNQPYVLKLTGPNGESNTVMAMLPNGSPTYVLPVERWAFVKSTHDIKLQDGVLQSITTDRPSSALAVASAPVDGTKAVFGAIAEVLQLKIDLSGKETALANAKVAEITAKSELDKALLAKNSEKAEAALYGTGATDAVLATLTIGVGRTDALEGMHSQNQVEPRAAPKPVRESLSNDGNMGNGTARMRK
ncbi:hypothetical protein [Pseudomonas sp. CCOS 191]|uniref:hypothetical protein n=1 Tax=Pseudomonas sp. CCOS 191 TaxID=1649877 RepID=UPI0018E68DF0|nr:hypothetical protein [Pseudomonas sp. CCOS 191]MBI6952012.1 hypothetical protein [Pseudomonas sp. CCOS 191]